MSETATVVVHLVLFVLIPLIEIIVPGKAPWAGDWLGIIMKVFLALSTLWELFKLLRARRRDAARPTENDPGEPAAADERPPAQRGDRAIKAVDWGIILGVVVITLLLVGQFIVRKTADVQAVCQQTLTKNQQQLRSLMDRAGSDRLLDSSDMGFLPYSALFGPTLDDVDLRTPDEATFTFCTDRPEKSRQLLYRPDDRVLFDDTIVLDEGSDRVRQEGLGVTGEGYVYCVRLQECWFYWEAYLPT
ncbi:MAG: hypothetical protein E7320_08975 [Clostridiales bacterium]|nr:hypothetical protein [Clostridiales bacterium]